MRDITVLFEYQKFSPNRELESKIRDVNSRFLSHGEELNDDVLDVSAAGEPGKGEPSADRKQ